MKRSREVKEKKKKKKAKKEKRKKHEEESDEEYGPSPSVPSLAPKVDHGEALRPGEGAAIAQYVQQNLRIPRRGEVGWSGDDIEKLENVGYVMSGSRHQRMNAVRIRKENQVASAEEKRALALVHFEEKQQQEAKLMADFRHMLQSRKPPAHNDRFTPSAGS